MDYSRLNQTFPSSVTGQAVKRCPPPLYFNQHFIPNQLYYYPHNLSLLACNRELPVPVSDLKLNLELDMKSSASLLHQYFFTCRKMTAKDAIKFWTNRNVYWKVLWKIVASQKLHGITGETAEIRHNSEKLHSNYSERVRLCCLLHILLTCFTSSLISLFIYTMLSLSLGAKSSKFQALILTLDRVSRVWISTNDPFCFCLGLDQEFI